MWANMQSGGVTLPYFQSLEAFWPGMQVRLYLELTSFSILFDSIRTILDCMYNLKIKR